MSRQARTQSKTNIYHVMMRGNNKQLIFRDDGDRRFFLRTLQECKEEGGFNIYAYCLMPNHVHILIRTGEMPLETVFRKIGTRYAGWFNYKYDRVGHLFQDRYKSENVEDECYFLTVLRYIMQNPVKAGMVEHPADYRWSSSPDYESGTDRLVDIQYAVSVVGSLSKLNDFLRTNNNDHAMDVQAFEKKEKENRAKEIMQKIADCNTPPDFRRLEKDGQKECINKMRDAGLSMCMISRLTGISKATISRMKQ